MQQTLNFLSVIDNKIKRSQHHKLKSISLKQKPYLIKKQSNRYPYAKAIDFTQSKYSEFPKWLIEKEGFVDFMYQNYQSKIMSIPKICEKQSRASDQKYFVSLYLSQIQTFKQLPQVVKDIVLDNLKAKYYAPGDIIHYDEALCQYVGIIYIGEVEYKVGKRTITKQKNDVIMLQAFHNKPHPEIICKEQAIILVLSKNIYHVIKQKLKSFIQEQQRDLLQDFMKSTFFSELHIKDQKAKAFYSDLELQFYLPDQGIEQAGTNPNRFYLIFKGEVKESNNIFVKQHNKWPLSNTKWQVRAVYNSFNKSEIIKQYKFFCDEEILDNLKLKSKYSAKTWSILFTMKSDKFISHLNSEDLKRIKKYRAQHVEIDYHQLEDKVRQRVKSNTERKKIVLKAINTVLINKTQLSPKKQKLIKNFESSMLRRPFFNETIE